MGLGVGIFRNFRIVQAEFRDCFRTVRVEFSGLFSNSPDKIFGTVFGQSGTGLRFDFDLGLMSSGFVVCFGITVIR